MEMRRRTINVSTGKMFIAGEMKTGILTNEGSVEVKDGGTMSVAATNVADVAANEKAFNNIANATITIKGGGFGSIRGSGVNPGKIVLDGAPQKPAKLFIGK
jgi:hypothetical protein